MYDRELGRLLLLTSTQFYPLRSTVLEHVLLNVNSGESQDAPLSSVRILKGGNEEHTRQVAELERAEKECAHEL